MQEVKLKKLVESTVQEITFTFDFESTAYNFSLSQGGVVISKFNLLSQNPQRDVLNHCHILYSLGWIGNET